MKKKLFFKLFIFAVIGAFVTVTSCKDYDDDIDRLDADLTALKSSKLEQSHLTALQTQLTGQITALQNELNTAKTKLTALESGSASKEQITALQTQIATLTQELNTLKNSAVSKEQIEALQAEITDLNEEIADVQANAATAAQKVATIEEDLKNAATKDEVEALQAELTAAKAELTAFKVEFSELQAEIVALTQELVEAKENFASKEEVAALEAKITELKAVVTALQTNSVTKEMLEAAKEEVLELVVKIETFNEYKEWVDTELASLKAELAKAATKEEVTALGNLFDSEIASVREELALAIANLEALETVVEGNSAAIADVETALSEQLAEIEANATEIAAVKADLQLKYDELTAEISALKVEIADIKADLTAFNEAMDAAVARLDDIDTEIEAVNARIDDLAELLGVDMASVTLNANSMITGISFDYQYDDWNQRGRLLDFSTAPARVSTVFGQGFPGAITFVSGQRLQNAEATLEVKVSPATADLSKMLDKITLVRRDGNNAINDILQVVKAERSTKLRASGPSVTGLWTLTFQMPSDANITSLSTLVEDATGSVTGTAGPYLFALAIDNSIDTSEDPADRYIVSDFGVEINATPKVPIYNNADLNNLEFSVGTGNTFTSYKSIKNRYATSENGITVPVDQMWNTGVWNTTATPTTVNDPADNRVGLPFYPVEVGKTFSVKLDATIADKVYAYYVVLDEKYALESAPSEWNAWSAYSIDGLNKVYMADDVAELKINSSSAIGDFIGFRVVVVNQDGTLVDPDGKSFYVTVGAQSSSWNAVNTVVTAQNPNELVPTATQSAKVDVTLSAVSGAAGFNWTTDAAQNNVVPAFHTFFLDANDNILFGTDGTGVVTANFANVKKVYTVATVNNWLQYTDNKIYNGTLTINNASGNVLRTFNVSFKKVLPTGAPAGFSVKTNQIANDGVYYSYLVPDNWTAPTATQGTMPLDQVFNFGSGLLINYQTTFAASSVSGSNLVPVTVTGNGTLAVAKTFVDNITQHATTVAYNYGLISTATPTTPYRVTIESFPTVFSNIYNHTYSWHWATRADLGLAASDPLPYSTSIEYGDTKSFDLAHIQGVSTRDAKYNAKLDAPYLNSLQVISAKLVSNANGLDEYFVVTPDPLAGATTFTLTQKSGSTNPTADVASTLVLTAKDMYNNDVEIRLPMTVTKR